LYGGVYADNRRARCFYQRHRFIEICRFTDRRGRGCIDMWKLLDRGELDGERFETGDLQG
jgi:hypothetical protein